jgi:hypothetical protein
MHRRTQARRGDWFRSSWKINGIQCIGRPHALRARSAPEKTELKEARTNQIRRKNGGTNKKPMRTEWCCFGCFDPPMRRVRRTRMRKNNEGIRDRRRGGDDEEKG